MITVIIPVSPIPSMPDIGILSETVASVRHHLPDVEIMLTFDGVRPEQEARRGPYEEAIRTTLWHADHDPLWRPVCPFIFDQHRHQSGMLRAVIDHIKTPLMLYVEADTPLMTPAYTDLDTTIDWDALCEFILSGQSNLTRLSHEATVLDAHAHLMHGQADALHLRTTQWSQRPHVASVAYYRRLLDAHFTEKTCAFIEDRLYSVIECAWSQDGMNGWLQHRLHLLTPPGVSIRRSTHLDGRAGDPKWDAEQIF